MVLAFHHKTALETVVSYGVHRSSVKYIFSKKASSPPTSQPWNCSHPQVVPLTLQKLKGVNPVLTRTALKLYFSSPKIGLGRKKVTIKKVIAKSITFFLKNDKFNGDLNQQLTNQ